MKWIVRTTAIEMWRMQESKWNKTKINKTQRLNNKLNKNMDEIMKWNAMWMKRTEPVHIEIVLYLSLLIYKYVKWREYQFILISIPFSPSSCNRCCILLHTISSTCAYAIVIRTNTKRNQSESEWNEQFHCYWFTSLCYLAPVCKACILYIYRT